jgi:hypothetical protein
VFLPEDSATEYEWAGPLFSEVEWFYAAPQRWLGLLRVRGSNLSDYEERLSASSARADSNFLVNRLAHHSQYAIRDYSHAVYRRDVIREVAHNLFVGSAASLELAPWNKVVTVKDSCHNGSPILNKSVRISGGS